MTKKQAFRAVIFIVGFLFLLRTVTYIIRTNGGVKDRFVGFYAEEKDSIDVLMVGSSPVYPTYSAPKLYGEHGIVAYPLSSNSQRPKAMRYLIKEAFKTQNPSLMIIELRMFTMPDDEWEENMVFTRGVTDNMKYSVNRINAINALVSNKEERYTYYFDIFKYHSNWKTLILPSQIACWNYEKLDPLKGLEIKYGVGPTEHHDLTGYTEAVSPTEEQVGVLYDLLDYVEEMDRDVLFIISPYVMDENARAQYNYIIPIIEEAGYPVLDFNDYIDEIGIDFSQDTYDYGSHVNALGQAKCTAFLGEYLKANYKLPDRRGQELYESWEDAWVLYQEKQAEAEASIMEDIANKKWVELID